MNVSFVKKERRKNTKNIFFSTKCLHCNDIDVLKRSKQYQREGCVCVSPPLAPPPSMRATTYCTWTHHTDTLAVWGRWTDNSYISEENKEGWGQTQILFWWEESSWWCEPVHYWTNDTWWQEADQQARVAWRRLTENWSKRANSKKSFIWFCRNNVIWLWKQDTENITRVTYQPQKRNSQFQ